MARRRKITLFSMSFLDCICCGFGAVILLFVIVNARSAATRNQQIMDLSGEVSRLEFEVLKGQKNLVQVRNALDESVEELVRTEGRSRRLLEQIKEIEQAIISAMHDAFADRAELSTSLILAALKNSPPLSVTLAESVEMLRSWAQDRCVPAD